MCSCSFLASARIIDKVFNEIRHAIAKVSVLTAMRLIVKANIPICSLNQLPQLLSSKVGMMQSWKAEQKEWIRGFRIGVSKLH